MKNFILALCLALSANSFAQIEPAVTYDGGDLYFVPAKLTSKGVAFMYSYKDDYESGKTWFTIFDDEVRVVEQVEIEVEVLNYSTRTVTSQRRFFIKTVNDSGTRAAEDTEYFLDNWTIVSDVTKENTERNHWIESPEVYEDNNNYHSRYMYLSQTLFDEDEDFEFLRPHYEVMPLSYCAADDTTGNDFIDEMRPNFGGETCDEYTREYDPELGGYVFTLIKRKVYGGIKETGTDIVALDGTVKKTLNGITSLGTVVAINGKFYVSAYDNSTSKYALYKIATATTSISKVAEITSETRNQATYNVAGLRVKPNTTGIVIRNGQKIINK